MKKDFRFIGTVFLILCVPLFAQEDHRRHRFDPQTYERPGRDQWQKPEEVVKALQLKAGDVIADIGAGSGYFTRRFAKAVASNGVVYAVDIDENMLKYIHKYIEQQKQHNIVTVLSAENDPTLAPGSVDVVFVCNTNHHLTNRVDYYKRVARALKKGGRVVIVDYQKKALPVGPPPDEKLSKEETISELTKAGYRLNQDLILLPYQYFLVFVR